MLCLGRHQQVFVSLPSTEVSIEMAVNGSNWFLGDLMRILGHGREVWLQSSLRSREGLHHRLTLHLLPRWLGRAEVFTRIVCLMVG